MIERKEERAHDVILFFRYHSHDRNYLLYNFQEVDKKELCPFPHPDFFLFPAAYTESLAVILKSTKKKRAYFHGSLTDDGSG